MKALPRLRKKIQMSLFLFKRRASRYLQDFTSPSDESNGLLKFDLATEVRLIKYNVYAYSYNK